ncbi:MAG TPA: polysaccharide biosynthesis/export family protein, partial [Terriglobales bacterium]
MFTMHAKTRTSVVYLKRVAAVSVAAIGLLLGPQISAQSTTPDPVVSKPAVSNGDLILGAGNLIDVKVFNAPELDSSLRLSEDGEANLPLIGSVHLGGLNVDEAQKLVQAKLVGGGFVKDPHVSILIREFTTQTVSVMGEVQHPGAFPITTTRRLMDAISAAGGFSARAGHTILINHRDDPAPETVNVSFDAQKLQQSNVELRPGDLITVGKAGLVYVTGEVNKPGGFLLDSGDSVTVLQALALAQGAKPTAS